MKWNARLLSAQAKVTGSSPGSLIPEHNGAAGTLNWFLALVAFTFRRLVFGSSVIKPLDRSCCLSRSPLCQKTIANIIIYLWIWIPRIDRLKSGRYRKQAQTLSWTFRTDSSCKVWIAVKFGVKGNGFFGILFPCLKSH